MRIAIDLDDTTFNTLEPMIKYADIYQTELTGRPIRKDFNKVKSRFFLKELYGWSDEEKYKFLDEYYKKILEECSPLPDSVKYINLLKSEGNEIWFVTARITSVPNCDTEGITKTSLLNAGIKYDKLIINTPNKVEFIKDNGIELCIDDSYEICKEANDCGIKFILISTKINSNIDDRTIKRANNWKEIYNIYQEIKYK